MNSNAAFRYKFAMVHNGWVFGLWKRFVDVYVMWFPVYSYMYVSIPAWRIPWTEEPGGPQSTGSQRVGHDWATSLRFQLTLSGKFLVSASPSPSSSLWCPGFSNQPLLCGLFQAEKLKFTLYDSGVQGEVSKKRYSSGNSWPLPYFWKVEKENKRGRPAPRSDFRSGSQVCWANTEFQNEGLSPPSSKQL